MELAKKNYLSKDDVVDEKYTVRLFLQEDNVSEIYRVKGVDGVIYFLKLMDVSKMHRSAFDGQGQLVEIELMRRITHPNIVTYKDHGNINIEGNEFVYLIIHHFSAENLAKRVERERISTVYEAREIARDILSGLDYLHNLDEPIVHRGITMDSIWIDITNEDKPVARIFDLRYAQYAFQPSEDYPPEDVILHYIASESLNHVFTPQSDLFSVGVLMYRMLFGIFPWQREIDNAGPLHKSMKDIFLSVRQTQLSIPALKLPIIGLDAAFEDMLQTAVLTATDKRYATAAVFIENLEKLKEIKTEPRIGIIHVHLPGGPTGKKRGFDSIAGMEDLKNELRREVIDALNKPEQFKKYRLTIPNGMLLWGPPGCGKTYFVKGFSEEVGRNFIEVKSSDLGSTYIHGAKEKIANLFNNARNNAPALIFIDEFDALVPSRKGNLDQHHTEEVNEFLTQMSSCGEHGIFIIGATNRPEKIDPAVLRSGRIDKIFYVPVPDFEARKSLFKFHLEERPLEENIDFDQLAKRTDNYVSSDIKRMVDDAAQFALPKDIKISMSILEDIITRSKPSVSITEIREYEARRDIGYDFHGEINLFEHLLLGRPKSWMI